MPVTVNLTEIPSSGCGEARNYLVQRVQLWSTTDVGDLNSVTAPLWSSTALLGGPSPARKLYTACSALLHSGLTRHLRYFIFRVSPPAREEVFTPWWKGKAHLSHKGADLYRQKSLLLVPDWSKSSLFDWSKKQCSNWSKQSLSDWLVKMLTDIELHSSD